MFLMCFRYRNASLAVVLEQLGWPANLWETAASARRCYRTAQKSQDCLQNVSTRAKPIGSEVQERNQLVQDTSFACTGDAIYEEEHVAFPNDEPLPMVEDAEDVFTLPLESSLFTFIAAINQFAKVIAIEEGTMAWVIRGQICLLWLE
ncbi:hypothetical protein MA16_Dca014190 [Dendrobium catenatum]|uniref:Uncharacterized protein n=1 Tax=Dendrobium catenatum TaxID=906689 RepID=A0A2I0VTM7_9ASPA|nr:hypothetical protein MA16_Dca014190 [Dendrobium catenatum]